MDPRAILLGLILAAIAILFGYQACFFFHLRMEGEIGGIRFGFLIATLVFSLTFVMTHLSSPLSLPVAVSALVFWSIFHLRDKITGEKIDRKFDEKELKKWERTIKIDPKSIGAYAALGDIYTRRKELNKAVSYYQNALRLHQSPSIQLKLRRALAEKNKTVKRENLFKDFVAAVGKKELLKSFYLFILFSILAIIALAFIDFLPSLYKKVTIFWIVLIFISIVYYRTIKKSWQ